MPQDEGVVSRKLLVASRFAEVARNKVARCSFSGKTSRWWKTGKPAASSQQASKYYAAFFPARIVAHRARCAAPIFLLADADIVRFAGTEAVFAAAGCDPFRVFAHRARCACAIFRRDAADITRFGWFAFRDGREPFNDSITVIA